MQKAPLLVIFLTVFIDLLGFGIVLPLLPRYAVQFQATDVTIGLLMSSFSAMQFVFAPIWGRLSDRVGRRPILMLGLAGSVVFYAMFGYATLLGNLSLLFVSRIGAGICGATIPTAQAYIADCTTPENRGRGMALIGAAFGMGFTFGPLLGAIWVPADLNAAPSAMPGFFAAVICAAALLMAIFVLPESLRPGTRAPKRPWLDFDSLRTALAIPTLGLLLAMVFLSTFAFANFEGTLARLTKDAFGYGDRYNFFLYAYVGFILTLGQGLLVRWLMPRLGEVKLVWLGTLTLMLGLAGIGLAAHLLSVAIAFIAMPMAALGFSALSPSLQALISRRTDPQKQGGILGVNQSVSAVARIFGPFFGNVVYDVGPAHAMPFWTGAVLMALGFVLALGIGRQPEDWTEDPVAVVPD